MYFTFIIETTDFQRKLSFLKNVLKFLRKKENRTELRGVNSELPASALIQLPLPRALQRPLSPQGHRKHLWKTLTLSLCTETGQRWGQTAPPVFSQPLPKSSQVWAQEAAKYRKRIPSRIYPRSFAITERGLDAPQELNLFNDTTHRKDLVLEALTFWRWVPAPAQMGSVGFPQQTPGLVSVREKLRNGISGRNRLRFLRLLTF